MNYKVVQVYNNALLGNLKFPGYKPISMTYCDNTNYFVILLRKRILGIF